MSLAVADSSKFIDALKESFSEEQAEQLFQALSLVGKEPLQNRPATRKEIKELEQTTRKEIKELEQTTRKEIKELNLKIEESREATRKEIASLKEDTKREIASLKEDTKREIKGLGEDTRREIKELDRKITGLEVKIAETKTETLKWTAGFLLAQTGVIVALIKVLSLL